MAEVDAGGVKLHIQRLGARAEGPVVVFIHGLVMDNLSSWYFTVAGEVAKVCEVLLYDLRGHGGSERPLTGYRVDDMVADLDALLSSAAPGRDVILVGNSFGGVVALAFAAANPARTKGLVLVDAHVSDETFGAAMADTLQLQGQARDQKIAESFQSWVGRNSDKRRSRLAERAHALVYETSLVADLGASAPISDETLAELTMPTVLIYGEKSDIVDRGRALAGKLSEARLVVLSGATHAILWEHTQDIRSETVALVNRVIAGR